MIFSFWKTSLAFIIAFSLQLLFFSMMQLETKEENIINPKYNSVQLLFIPTKEESVTTETIEKNKISHQVENLDTDVTVVKTKFTINNTEPIKYTRVINLTANKREFYARPEPKGKPLLPVITKTIEKVHIKKEVLETKNNNLVISTLSNIPIQNTYNLSTTELVKADEPSTSPNPDTNKQYQRIKVDHYQLMKSNNLKQVLVSRTQDSHINSTYKKKSENDYNTIIRGILNNNHRYPNRAIRQQKSGTTTLSFTLLSSGHVNESSIAASSGHTILDKAAVTMLNRSKPFPPFPNDIDKSHIDFIIPIEFKLQ